MDARLKKEIDVTLRTLDIDREERPQTAQIIEEVAEYFYNLGRRDRKKNN